jgi:glycerate dehydrogenase
MKPNIVFLDAKSNGDVDFSPISNLGKLTLYDNTSPEEYYERCMDADVIIVNKFRLMKPEIDLLPKLKLICISATGMNNVDVEAAKAKGIPVKNVENYSTDSVAEMTFAMVFELLRKFSYYDNYVKSGLYSQSNLFTHHGMPFYEISGKRWGIIGLGNIGKRVAEIATSFKADISYYSTSGKNNDNSYRRKSLEDLVSNSDIISIHAPLNSYTLNLIDYKKICMMKPDAIIVNVGRGGIVNEADLARALKENRIKGAAMDVFVDEPLPSNHPFLDKNLDEKLLLAPHIAWASIEARQRLVDVIAKNIKSHFSI